MSSVPLIETFGRIVYGFTRGLTEHYNPEEPEYTAEILGYHPPGGGTVGISGWGCAAGTLEPLTYTRASSAEFCYPILE